MIDRAEIDTMAERLDIDPSHVQRDYVHSWITSKLYSSSKLANILVLKGGNCLRKGYFANSRYSRDLDFTTSIRISNDELHYELNSICEAVGPDAGIEFDTSRTMVKGKNRVDKDKAVAEARVYFNDFYGNESKLILAVRLDVTQFDRLHLPMQVRNLVHPYSDFSDCTTPIKCVKLEELLASKMRCLLQRKHIADLFDLVYATMINQSIAVNRTELLSTFFKITIFGSRPAVVKGLFQELPLDTLESFWNQFITCPKESRFAYENAKTHFQTLIDALIPERAERKYDPVFFPASLRNPILHAAESQTLLRLTYDGIERLVEPYELSFKRRKDGIGREYLFVYDQTGGRSSEAGIKTFVSNKIEMIENTEISFEPRAPIELSKSGGAETAGRFVRRRRARSSGVFSGFGRTQPRKRTFSAKRRTPAPYKVECPYCGKRFPRQKPDTKLNPHKDKYGNKCYGRRGHLIYT